MLLIKNAQIYSPENLGTNDLLISEGKIIKIQKNINEKNFDIDMEIIDADNKIMVPGYIDQHVHIIGGGGEAGFYSRTPEILLSKVAEAGVTTVVGVLGTDGTTRNLESLLAKTRALETEGITAYMLTGSYEVPVNNLTGDIRRDIILIDKIIGVGEIALSDHRSSQPTKDEMKRIATQARVGGMLSGKCGIVQLHMGVGANGLNMIFDIVNETEIPVKHFIPTHVNRKAELLQQAMEFAKMGGYIDLTSGIRPEDGFDESIKPSKAIKMCVENNVPMDRITMSSDGNGSMAVYNKNGFVERLLVTTLDSLHDEFRLAVLDEGVDISTAVKIITGNVANALKLYPAKGNIGVGADADILLLNEQLEIEYVIAMGKKLMENKKVIVKGTFEE